MLPHALHINVLPDVIIHTVLGHVSALPCYDTHEWKQRLLLLSVCSRWRGIGLASVYENAEITYGDVATTLKVIATHAQAIEPAPSVVTNIDLAIATGNMHRIRCLHITINYLYDPYPGLYHIHAYLHSVACHWKRVHTLELAVRGNHALTRTLPIGSMEQYGQIVHTSRALAQLMPCVKDLRLGGLCPSTLAHVVYATVVREHCARINKLRSNYALLECSDIALASVTHLDMGFGTVRVCQMPSVTATTLVSLSLSSVPLDYEWLPFADSTNYINFSSLRALSVSYRSVHPSLPLSPARACTLRFPMIEHLHVMAPSTWYPIIKCSEFPLKTRNMHIDGAIALIQQLDHEQLPRIGLLSLNLICDDSHDMSTALDAISDICRRASYTSTVRLEVFNTSDIVVTGTCPFITEVDIKAPVAARTVLAIIRAMPKLVRLELAGILCSPQHPIFPLSLPAISHIRMLSIIQHTCEPTRLHHSNNNYSQDSCVAFVQFLLLHLPRLSVLYTRQISDAPIRTFARMQILEYPHLANIELNLK
ncbi:hypothetical protein GGH12_004822 [Coemansia sp. RSA 1822]|nr:hypothetical protein LPJ76_005053 [Coemansia sp. RSA 638]KAJ2560438.1 hypothetical protein GGH12_004822 [Coemansia sp. RSA 1822]